MRDDTKERIDKLEAFMDEQKLKQAQQAAISEYKKERFHFWKENSCWSPAPLLGACWASSVLSDLCKKSPGKHALFRGKTTDSIDHLLDHLRKERNPTEGIITRN